MGTENASARQTGGSNNKDFKRSSSTKIYKGVRGFYPHDYWKRSGYQIPVAPVMQYDSLG